MNAPFLSRPARPPHDPLTLRLDRRAGWRAGALPAAGVAPATGDGALTLQALPASERRLDEESGSFGGLAWPDHVAPLPGGGLLLLDRAAGRLRRFDRCTCRFADWPCLGCDPADARRPVCPGGIAVACGQVYLCDTGNARLLVFSLVSGTVRAQWPAPGAPGLLPWQPRDVAVGPGGEVFVSDPANGGIHVFSTCGSWRRLIGGLGAVRALAFDCDGRLYASIDGEAGVRVLDCDSGRTLERPTRPGDVAARFAALPVRVLRDGAIDVTALCACPPDGPAVFDAAGEPVAAQIDLTAWPEQGVWFSAALDSDIARCTWHRAVLDGVLPPGTRIEVWSLSSESDEPPELIALKPAGHWQPAGVWRNAGAEAIRGRCDWLLRSPPGRYLWLRLVLHGDGHDTPRVHALNLEFPRISLRRYLPAVFGAEPVAADFTDRWLAVFDHGFRDIESTIDHQARLFDPLACPAAPSGPDFLGWLAGWVGVALERNWPEARRRAYLKQMPKLYPWRGTVGGLRRQLHLFLGLDRWQDYEPARACCVPCPQVLTPGWRPPRLILEHFQLRRWMLLDRARLSDNAKLWGERIVNRSRLGGPGDPDPGNTGTGARLGVSQLKKSQDPCRDPFHVHAHQLSVFVPAACVRDPAMARALARLLDLERPAHVQARVVPVEPRFRIGVQAMLGLDAVIGWQAQPLTLDDNRLGRATVLSGNLDDRPRLQVGKARVGGNTVLP
jgi:phage tail-like protein